MNLASDRPDPDRLLARVQHEEDRAKRGKLRIFFGYAAGVGKTYAMLEAARRERDEVVIGYVEPHGRAETEALLDGLEKLPVRTVPYRGVNLHELDLDAALLRRPRLLLVDELAHTNAEGSRHAKRWQDVFELLDAGIDVWTTLNVQHIESLNDVISQITGVVVGETLPDSVLERADEIELVDLTPEELLERFKAGKVYVLRQVDLALQGFFQKGNLVALRELSLRQTANRLQRDVEAARHERFDVAPWLTAERLLVCVGPSPSSARILRSTKRLAASLRAEWLAVAVNTTGDEVGHGAMHEQTGENLRLAEKLGAETHTLIGDSVADALLDFARERNVSKIVVGKTAQPWWKRRFVGTIVDHLLGSAGTIDVYVVSGESDEPLQPARRSASSPPNLREYGLAAATVAVCTAAGWAAHELGLAEANIVMIFLAGVALVATRFGRGPAIGAAVVSVLVFDFCFVPPYFTFAVGDSEYIITFGVMLGIGLLISGLASRQRSQLKASQRQERRTSQLFRMTRQLSELSGTEFLIRTAGRQLSEIFGGEVVIYVRETDRAAALRYGEETSIANQPVNRDVAQWVADNGKLAGRGTDTLPNATALFVPLVGSQRTVGSVGVRPPDADQFMDPEQVRLLETCASLVALSLERDESVLEAHQAHLDAETEKLRSSLLSAVSHDIRTPLAGIAGASSTLAAAHESLDAATRSELLRTINEESERLSRLVDNLLQMTRLSSGKVAIDRQWHPMDEIVGSTLTRMERQLGERIVETHVDADLSVDVDAVLIEQLLVNLVGNAMKYSSHDSPIKVSAGRRGEIVEIEVADRGRGFIPGDEQRVFDLFYRGSTVPSDRWGTGIGLAICRAIAEVHGGTIEARNREGGGAAVRVTLPHAGSPPRIDLRLVGNASP